MLPPTHTRRCPQGRPTCIRYGIAGTSTRRESRALARACRQDRTSLSLSALSLFFYLSSLLSAPSFSLSRCTVHLHGTLGVAPTMCPLPLPLPLPPPQPGPRRTWQGGGRDEYRPAHYSLKRSKTKQALVPPKPNELDMTRETSPSWRFVRIFMPSASSTSSSMLADSARKPSRSMISE